MLMNPMRILLLLKFGQILSLNCFPPSGGTFSGYSYCFDSGGLLRLATLNYCSCIFRFTGVLTYFLLRPCWFAWRCLVVLVF